MRILGIDPGSRIAGWALIEYQKKKFSYLDSGIIKFNQKELDKSFIERLNLLHLRFKEVTESLDFDVVSLESLIHVKNVSSLAKLSQARAALITALSCKKNLEFFEYSPNKIKSSVSGFGHLAKQGIEDSVKLILGDKTMSFASNDESDAAAIAICHGLNAGNIKTISGTSKGQTLSQAFKHLG